MWLRRMPCANVIRVWASCQLQCGSHDDEVGLTFAHLDSGHRDGAEVAEGCEPRTFRCQNPAERIPICAGTKVEAVGEGGWKGSVRGSSNGAVGLENSKK